MVTCPQGSFRGVPKLHELRLQGNSLREVARDTFANLALLSELHLQVGHYLSDALK